MVNIIRKVIATSGLLISSSVLAEVSHVSINQTLFEVGEAADFRVNVVAEDVDDLRFFLHDGENEERLSVEALNTFMLNVTGDRPVSSSNALLVVHEYLKGEWQKRQEFSLALTPRSSTSMTEDSVSENNQEKLPVDKNEAKNVQADGLPLDNRTHKNRSVEVTNTASSSNIESNNVASLSDASLSDASLSEASALNASSVEGSNLASLSEASALNASSVEGSNLAGLSDASLSEASALNASSVEGSNLAGLSDASLSEASALNASSVEGNNLAGLSDASALNASSVEGNNLAGLSETNALNVEGLVNAGTANATGINTASANASGKSSEPLLSATNMSTNEKSLVTESLQSSIKQENAALSANNIDTNITESLQSSITQENAALSVNNIDTNQIASQQTAFKDEIILASPSEENSVKESTIEQPERVDHQESRQANMSDDMNRIDGSEGTEVCPIIVAKDETLWKIDVRYHKQWGVGLFGGALALFEANPKAFNKGSIHGLKAGARLTCPSDEILAKYQDESLAERFFLAM
ncbi:hypothetical protein [uncultured Shewanella sp.]|uniref:hypothetical protein n=1 Tax=uncultured Shewanella sp. TaxID=173975 RepID=UPI00260C9BBE|nr:hypothetical protein [uncultured Shewanella sp.]